MTTPLRVHIVLSPDNSSWIIEKMAHRLAEMSGAHGVSVSVGPQPDPSADLNHWMSYAFANVRRQTPTTIGITHLDDPYKIRMVAKLLENEADLGICLSSAHREFLAANGIADDKLVFVVPAHDFAATPRRIVIGLTTRLYKDGRKREAMLVAMARAMPLDAFRFEIFGSGWDEVVPVLEQARAEVRYSPGTEDYVADYQEIVAALPLFDYYLYLGRDEGSLGTLDALSAGVRTIVTPQGFHCDLPNGITHSVWNQSDLEGVFKELARDRQQRIDAVAPLTWDAYAREHVALWRAVVSGVPVVTSTRREDAMALARHEDAWQLRKRYLHPRRVVSALSHVPILKPLRKLVRRK